MGQDDLRAAALAPPSSTKTPGMYPDNKDIYCRSYCPTHPQVHAMVFDLIDEILDAFSADTLHAGMDEVFIIGDNACPRCKGQNKAKLFAGEVRAIHDHLAEKGRRLWFLERSPDRRRYDRHRRMGSEQERHGSAILVSRRTSSCATGTTKPRTRPRSPSH